MQEAFIRGMLVVLKTGGPVMTVRAVSQHHAYCDWMDGTVYRQGTFEISRLQPAPATARAAAQPK
jgi:uncharacterized protein YodC (DUF2158 family)